MAQPPFPLQLFLALQPLSPDLQPPVPLHSFLPLQECLSLSAWFRCDLTQVGGADRSAAARGMQRHCGSAEQAAYGRAQHYCFH